MTNRDYLFKRIFHMDVIIKGLFGVIWSPGGGVSGFVYSGDKIFPCVAVKENFQDGENTCRLRCDGRYGLDFELLEIRPIDNNDLMAICEIEFK